MQQVAGWREQARACTQDSQSATRLRSVAVPLLLYGVIRVIDAVFLSIGASARQAQVTDHIRHYVWDVAIPASPGYWGVLANWDGQWYKSIAIDWYPTVLPSPGNSSCRAGGRSTRCSRR